MFLDVPVRRVEGLPDTVQVRFAVRRARRLIGLGLRGDCRHDQLEGGYQDGRGTRKSRASRPLSHLCLLSNPAVLHVPQVQPSAKVTLALSACFRESIFLRAFQGNPSVTAFGGTRAACGNASRRRSPSPPAADVRPDQCKSINLFTVSK